MNTEKIWSKIEEREQADELLNAVKAEKKTGFFEFLRDMLFGLGLKNVFYGVYDAVFVLLALSAAMIVSLSIQPRENFAEIGGELYGYVFAASPVAYFVFFLISYFKEKLENSFSVKMTCRYTVLHLSAFRMFAAGVVCLVVNAAAAAIMADKMNTDLLNIVAVSFSSLFLFALVTIVSLLKLGSKGAAVPAGLIAVSIALCAFPEYSSFLQNIPTAAYLILGVFSLAVYQKILTNIERKYSYVVR